MSIDWNAVYGEAKKSNASLGSDQTGQAKKDEAAELAALKNQKEYFDSLFSADKQAEQRSAGLSHAITEKEIGGKIAAQGGGEMSETLRSSLLNNMQLANTQAQGRFDDATKKLAATYGTTASNIKASYAQLMSDLTRQNRLDTLEEGRHRYEAEEAQRQYEQEHAFAKQKFDVENQQWQARHDMALTQNETGKQQWQADFDMKNAQAQEKIDFARAEWELKKQQETKQKTSSKGGGRKSRGKGATPTYDGAGYYQTSGGSMVYVKNKDTYNRLSKNLTLSKR